MISNIQENILIMTITSKLVKSTLLGLLFGLSILIISIAIHINPSKTPPYSPFNSNMSFLLFALSLFIISTCLFIAPMIWNKKNHFFLIYLLSLTIQLVMVLSCAVFLHRDYYTVVFQLFIIYTLIFLFQHKLSQISQ